MPGITSAPSASISRTGTALDGADVDDHAVAHGDVGGSCVGAGPVHEGPTADDQVVLSHGPVSHRRRRRDDPNVDPPFA